MRYLLIFIAFLILLGAGWGISPYGVPEYGSEKYGVGSFGSGGEPTETYWTTAYGDLWTTAYGAKWTEAYNTEIP